MDMSSKIRLTGLTSVELISVALLVCVLDVMYGTYASIIALIIVVFCAGYDVNITSRGGVNYGVKN